MTTNLKRMNFSIQKIQTHGFFMMFLEIPFFLKIAGQYTNVICTMQYPKGANKQKGQQQLQFQG